MIILCGTWSCGGNGTAQKQFAPRPAVTGVDIGDDAHAGAKFRIVRFAVAGDPHRNALHHLDPVARRILRRQHGKLRATVGGDAFHAAIPAPAWIGIDGEGNRIAWLHIVSSVSFGLASIQVRSVDTRPNAAVEAARYMPGCTVSTIVTTPANGA